MDRSGESIDNYYPVPEDRTHLSNIITSLYSEVNSDLIWVGIRSGLFSFSRINERFELKYSAVQNDTSQFKSSIYNLADDNSGHRMFNVWDGIYRFSPDEEPLSFQTVYSLPATDKWISTFNLDG